VEYWERKVDLFGTNTFHKLTFLDLLMEDRVALEQGGIQLLPHVDAAGRILIFSHRKLHDLRPEHPNRRKSMQRLLWCAIHAAIDDEDMGEGIQKAGAVGFLLNGLSNQDIILTTRSTMQLANCCFSDLMTALPIRLVALHHFQPEVFARYFLLNATCTTSYLRTGYFLLNATGTTSYLRTRLVLHHSSPEQTLQNLVEYGIDRSMIPEVLGGDLDFDYSEWLQDKLVECAEDYYATSDS